MPVTKLLVEGKLDAVLLAQVLDGRPLVERGGSKNALRPKVLEERKRAGNVCYVRDRDFDMDPPEDRSRPAIHQSDATGAVLGWHWCRHEMENYLLDPRIVASATGCDEASYCAALRAAAARIVDYQAARGAIGEARRWVPPSYHLRTKPSNLSDDTPRLPDDLGADATIAWAREEATRFRDRLCPQLDPSAIHASIVKRRGRLSSFVESVEQILVWFAGKDLMAALEPWLASQELGDPGGFRATLRDWLRDHPERALTLLPEWAAFVTILRQ